MSLSKDCLLTGHLARTRFGHVKTALSRSRSRVRLDAEIGGDDETDAKPASATTHAPPMIQPLYNESLEGSDQHWDDPLLPILSLQERNGHPR